MQRFIDKIVISKTEPSNYLLWVDVNNNNPVIKVYNNGLWQPASGSEDTLPIASNTKAGIVKILVNNGLNVTADGSLSAVITHSATSSEISSGSTSSSAAITLANFITALDKIGVAYDVDISAIEALIPTQATSSNQLADKNFVNSSIATSTATFKGTFNSVDNLPTTDVDDNDYAFVITTDAAGNTVYKRYKYSNNAWSFEYDLNNSSFTAAQWAAINSGITSANAVLKSGTTSASPMTGALYFNNNTYIANASGDVVAKVNNINCFGNVSSTSKIRSLVPVDRVGVSDTMHMVESPSIVTITKLTQSEFNALASYTANTEYNIVEE